MVKVALLAQLEAKPGKDGSVLKSGVLMVEDAPETAAWFALRLGPTSVGIFDPSPSCDGHRSEHLSRRTAAALMAKACAVFEDSQEAEPETETAATPQVRP